MEEQLVETWKIHDRINRYLLDAVPDEALGSSLAPKHRTVAALFAHLHNVRLMWIKVAAPELMKGLEKIEADKPPTKALLRKSLEASGSAVAELVGKACDAGG